MTRHIVRWSLPLALAAVLGVGAAMAATSLTGATGTVKIAQNGKYGAILVSSSGHTLYRLTSDPKGKSTCKAACVQTWPALMVKKGAKPTAGAGAKASLLGTIKRANGLQVTYAGYPLYWFSGDPKSGDVNGEGVDDTWGKWYAINAKGALVKHAVASGSGSTTSTTSTTTTKTGWG